MPDILAGGIRTTHLHQVEAHAEHRDAKEQVERAKGNSHLAVSVLLVRDQVPEPDGGQGDEAEVGAVKQ